MNLLTFTDPVQIGFTKSSGEVRFTLEAGREYLFTAHQTGKFLNDPGMADRIYKVTKCDPRISNFRVDLSRGHTGERLLLFNGSGGFGDQIMTWPVARLLSQWYEVHVLTDPGNTLCWWNMRFAAAIHTLPIQWQLLRLFNHLAIFEEVVNVDEHPDQEHPIDTMLRKIGIEPSSVPDAAKVVKPIFTYTETLAVRQRLTALNGKKFGLYQLSSANPVRALAPSDSVFMVLKLAQTFPDTHWFALHDEFIPKTYTEPLVAKIAELGLTNIEVGKFPSLRELWAFTEHASVVVAPDSMMVHAAGMFGVPCVGLWGPVDPSRRVRYYANHRPIFHKSCCVHAPCFSYSAQFPRYCPPRPHARTTCECMSAISAQDIVDAVGAVRR